MNGRMKKLIDGPITSALDSLSNRAAKQGKQLAETAVSESARSARLIITIVLLAIGAGLFIGYFTSRSIAGPLGRVCSGMEAIQVECMSKLSAGVNALAD